MLIDCRYGGRVPWDGSRSNLSSHAEIQHLAKPPTNARILRRPSVRPANLRFLHSSAAKPLLFPAVCAKPQLFPSPPSGWLSIGCSAHLPRRGRLFVVIDSSASRSRHPGVPSSPVLPCDDPNTMIDLDDKENQSPLRLGFGKSPSPKRSRTKNTAPAGQDVSDAPSKQSPSQPLALVACSSSLIADLVALAVSSSICSQVHPPVQTR